MLQAYKPADAIVLEVSWPRSQTSFYTVEVVELVELVELCSSVAFTANCTDIFYEIQSFVRQFFICQGSRGTIDVAGQRILL